MLEQLIYLRRYLFSVAGEGRRGAGQTQTQPYWWVLFYLGLASFLQKMPNEVVRRHENNQGASPPTERRACGSAKPFN